MRGWRALLLLGSLLTADPLSAEGRVLVVGPDRTYASPAAAAAAAQDGDTVRINPGHYAECAVWTADRLTLEGAANGVTIADVSCEGKALWVIRSRTATVRGIAFTGARVPDANGAGIRFEGEHLTVEDSSFENNENGILMGGDFPDGTVTIRNSRFVRNGSCLRECAHGIYIGRIGHLRVENSLFSGQRDGHHIKSRARVTEIIGGRIEDGDAGSSSYLVDIPNGGGLLIDGTEMEKGRFTSNRLGAVILGAEGATNPAAPIRVQGVHFSSRVRGTTGFVVNRTTTPAELSGIRLTGAIRVLQGPGRTRP